MARISGIDLPRDKRIEIGLTYIFGIGRKSANDILKATGINPDTRVKDLTEDEVQRLRDYIDKHYNEPILLEQIAAAVKANKYYLAHMFKAETGFSPLQYVVRRRIGEAQNLLINTDMSITQIAATVGYNNSNYFQNIFRKYMGMTPGYYRKKWKS